MHGKNWQNITINTLIILILVSVSCLGYIIAKEQQKDPYLLQYSPTGYIEVVDKSKIPFERDIIYIGVKTKLHYQLERFKTTINTEIFLFIVIVIIIKRRKIVNYINAIGHKINKYE